MDKYPTLSLMELEKIANVLEHAKADPRYLDGRVSPYDEKTRKLLKSMLPNPVAAATLTDAEGKDKKKVGRPSLGIALPLDELKKEFGELLEELRVLKVDSKGLEPNERIQLVKLRVSIVEKTLAIKERIGHIDQVERFMAEVIELLEAEMPQENRLKVIEALGRYKAAEDEA